MPSARVHNLAVSLDGFGSGAHPSREAPFGHAGTHLMEWFFSTPTFPRGDLQLGETTFHFLDAPPREALGRAFDAAQGLDVRIGGGPSTVRRFLAEGLVDLLHVVQVPILLGRGSHLWRGLEGWERDYEVAAETTSSGVTHLTFARTAQ